MNRMFRVGTLAALACATAAFAGDEADGPRGTKLVPAGDNVHGHLRGGETHVLQVHLAAGDVYSFRVVARGSLVMHMSLRDPQGSEINSDAHVVHHERRRRITVGPFRAATSGTYSIELSGQSWFEGDYYGASRVRGARRFEYSLPTDGSVVTVPVAAGSSLHVKSSKPLPGLLTALPGESPVTLPGSDSFVRGLERNRVSTSETGDFQFGAPGFDGTATLEVMKPRWKRAVVEVPTLPDDPSRLERFDWIFDWSRHSELPQTWIDTPPITTEGVPTAVPTSVRDDGATTLFVGSMVSAVEAGMPDHLHPPELVPPTDGDDPPAPTPGTVPVAFVLNDPRVPVSLCARSSSMSLLMAPSDAQFGWRDGPWVKSRFQDAGADPLSARLLPFDIGTRNAGSMPGGGDDPWVRYTADLFDGEDHAFDGHVEITTRYFVDGHQVPYLAVTKGVSEIRWSIDASGTHHGAAWTVSGSWTLALQTDAQWAAGCSLTGEERYRCGDATETLSIPLLQIRPVSGGGGTVVLDAVGKVKDTLYVPGLALPQSYEREIGAEDSSEFKPIRVRFIESDPSHPDAPAREALAEFMIFVC